MRRAMKDNQTYTWLFPSKRRPHEGDEEDKIIGKNRHGE
jgi:hypothetical protein